MPSLKVVEELGSRNIAVDCKVVMKIGEKAMEDPNEIGAASVDFTMFSGYVVLAYMWAQMAALAGAATLMGLDESALRF